MRQLDSVSLRARPTRHGNPANATVAHWIARTLAADPPRARSLIVTVWGDALAPHDGRVWLATLIRLMAPFGLSERLVRTSVFRLARDGWVAGETHGRRSRYRLTSDGARRFAHAHQRIYAPADEEWNGEWEMVVAPPDGAPAARRQALRDELAWEGFAALAPAVFARPAHGGSTAHRILAALGVADGAMVLRVRDDPDALGVLEARAANTWPLRALAADYRKLIARFGMVIDRFRSTPQAQDAEQCFVVRTLLIHAYRRVLLRDPQLPPSLLPAEWPGAAAYALTRDFYRLTHAVAERHLAATFAADGEVLPPADATFYNRFGGLQR
ncbi:MAG TPA: phenylacetic acid degradation operon negative regulatory protein PaaX [Casimicrobiaceae bacterium]|nr:phenylacetic acid degradation operon negative regulatory protein PaaX [Casimicrobiaceae bacterium]